MHVTITILLSCSGSVTQCARIANVSDTRSGGFGFLGWLSKTLSQCAKLCKFTRFELGIALREIHHGGIKPLFLVNRMAAYYTALHDLLKQLITGLLIRRRNRAFTTWTKLMPGHFLWVEQSYLVTRRIPDNIRSLTDERTSA